MQDVEKIVLMEATEVATAIADLNNMGYDKWIDGRTLEDVVVHLTSRKNK